ncbi:MAG: TetR/AcrR family transcriptional regulator [Sinobacteraceae bacterium]|nr:TetR/AcrR family transcriptional regulator [Nevskia sp.]MDI3258681.1 TetR/AcrR family transcriptional regulator [Nevskiaceae bacterium]
MKAAAARKPAPRLSRAARTEALLHAARAVFAAKGYEQAAVAEIAARCGVVEGAVYKYFPTKRALLLAVLARWYEEMFGDYARELASIDGARERLRFLIERHLRSIRDWPQLCRLMFREVRAQPDYPDSPLYALNRRYSGLLLRVIEEGAAQGEFRADLSPRLVRDLIFGGIEHHTWRYLADARTPASRRAARAPDIARLADPLTRLVCEGLMPRAPTRRKRA